MGVNMKCENWHSDPPGGLKLPSSIFNVDHSHQCLSHCMHSYKIALFLSPRTVHLALVLKSPYENMDLTPRHTKMLMPIHKLERSSLKFPEFCHNSGFFAVLNLCTLRYHFQQYWSLGKFTHTYHPVNGIHYHRLLYWVYGLKPAVWGRVVPDRA